MKKTLALAFLLMTLGVTNAVAQEAPARSEDFEVNIPCLKESFDDENSVSAWGIGKSTDRNEARMLAMQDAINALAQRFHVNRQTIASYARQWCMDITMNNNNECVVYVSIHVSKDAIYKAIKEAQ